jgi:hypothetical protein
MNGYNNCFSLEKGLVFNIPENDEKTNMLTNVKAKGYRGFSISELEVWEVLEIEE